MHSFKLRVSQGEKDDADENHHNSHTAEHGEFLLEIKDRDSKKKEVMNLAVNHRLHEIAIVSKHLQPHQHADAIEHKSDHDMAGRQNLDDLLDDCRGLQAAPPQSCRHQLSSGLEQYRSETDR